MNVEYMCQLRWSYLTRRVNNELTGSYYTQKKYKKIIKEWNNKLNIYIYKNKK